MDDNVRAVLAAAVQANVPVMAWGQPGIGKTTEITAMFANAGMLVRVVTGNVRMPEDFAGLPRTSGDSVELVPPKFAVELSEHPAGGVLVLDELPTSTPAVQNAMLRLVCERYAGDYRLGDGVRIIAIGNPVDGGTGWNLSGPLANRFLHLDVGVDADQWITGMLTGWAVTPPAPLPTPTGPLGPATVVGYVQARRDQLAPGQPPIPAEAGKAWRSPRSWDHLSRVLPYCHSTSEQLLAAAGCVGAAAAQEFMTWTLNADLPSPETLIADPERYDWNGGRDDRTFAALGSLVAYVARHDDRWDDAWNVLGVAASTGCAGVGAQAAEMLLRMHPGRDVPPRPMLAYADLIAAIHRR